MIAARYAARSIPMMLFMRDGEVVDYGYMFWPVPDDEDLECRNKAAALLAAIPAARRMTRARRDAGTTA